MKNHLVLILSTLSLSTFSVGFGNIGFPGQRDIDHMPTQPSYGQDHIADCEVVTQDGEKISLKDKTRSLTKAFKIIESTSHGAKLVKLFRKTDIPIKNFTSEIRNSLSQTAEAAFVYDEKEEIIYVDYSAEVGKLSVILAHEIVHALDKKVRYFRKKNSVFVERYNNLLREKMRLAAGRADVNIEHLIGKENLTKEEDELLIKLQTEFLTKLDIEEIKEVKKISDIAEDKANFIIEKFAFTEENKFTNELKENNSCFKEYIEDHKLYSGFQFAWEVSDEFIFRAYPSIRKDYVLLSSH